MMLPPQSGLWFDSLRKVMMAMVTDSSFFSYRDEEPVICYSALIEQHIISY